MSNTPILKLPQIAESQGSKHITHNEALRQIEAVLVRVLSRSVDDETTLSPTDGDSYIVAAASFAVVGVDTGGEIFRISGDETGRMNVGDSIEVSGSTGNDGTYTISALNYDSTNDETDITVQEDVTDSTADGDVLHAAGAFNAHRQDVAYYYGGAWSFVTAVEGFGPLWVNDEDGEVRFDGSQWVASGGSVEVEDSGTSVLLSASGLDFASGLNVTDNGDGTVSIAVGSVSSVFSMPVQTKTADYTVQTSDQGNVIAVTDTTSARTITLPAAGTAGDGFTIAVYIGDATNTVTVDADSTELIDDSETLTLSTLGDSVLLVADGSKWRTVASQITSTTSGDVTGPSSSVNNTLPRFNGTTGKSIKTSGVVVDNNDNFQGHGQTVQSEGSDFTLSSARAGKVLEVATGAAATVTVPANSNVSLPVGYTVTVVQADGNAVSFSGQSGVTIQSKGGLTSTNGQWSAATLYKRATDTWVLIGDLA